MIGSAVVVSAVLAAGVPFPQERGVTPQSALARGDTTTAIALLDDQRAPSVRDQCLLATLITGQLTSRMSDWRGRVKAENLFRDALRREPDDPACLVGFAALMEKQGIRVDAARLARRALSVIERNPASASPTLLAEIYYRRALLVTEWVRQFDHLVAPSDLPVSTPNCLDAGPFCLSVGQPGYVLERLRRATSLSSLVDDERGAAAMLLDSALGADPSYTPALRLALQRAALDGNGQRFAAIAEQAWARDKESAFGALSALTARVLAGAYTSAAPLFDSLLALLPRAAVVEIEALTLIADSSVRDRLNADGAEVATALWELSDPLYATLANERRLLHYARAHLADLVFGDPASRVRGRDTPQGGLVIRYGFPPLWFQVPADRARELLPGQRVQMREILGCATKPLAEGEECLLSISNLGLPSHGGGRWTFWFYDSLAPPFIFEGRLGQQVARHMQFTQSERWDSLMHEALPSTSPPPFPGAVVAAQVTRFPRPGRPVIEVAARFSWVATSDDSVNVGVYVHDLRSGARLSQFGAVRAVRDGAAVFGGTVPLPDHPVRVTVEGLALRHAQGAQRHERIVPREADAPLWMSDLMLGDSAQAPAVVTRRSDVRMDALYGDSIASDAPIGVYWEVYGLVRDGLVAYEVDLEVASAGARAPLTTVVRGLGRLLGLGQVPDIITWSVRREVAGDVVPNLIVVRAPTDPGSYVLRITVREPETGNVTCAERTIVVRP